MTIEQLKAASALQVKINALKEQHRCLTGDSKQHAIEFRQQNNHINSGVVTAYEHIECSGLEQQTQTVLLATKQTIISIYERELQKLEKEFKQI